LQGYDLFEMLPDDIKRDVDVIKQLQAFDAKGRAIYTDGERKTIKAIVQHITTPFERNERKDVQDEPLNLYCALSNDIEPTDVFEIDGVRYAITVLHITNLQIEIELRKQKR